MFFSRAGIVVIGALALSVIGSHAATADQWADVVVDSTASSAGSDNNVLGAADGSFRSLGAGNYITVDFTENVCLGGDTGAADLKIYEIGNPEGYDVEVGGLASGSLTAVAGTPDGVGNTSIDVSDVAGISFNRVKIIDDNLVNGGGTEGADIDAVECLNNFDLGVSQIQKSFLGGVPTIYVQTKGGMDEPQHFEFVISITNTNGEILTNVVFKDVVPAEFDLDGAAENAFNGCADGTCDGIAVTNTDTVTCIASGAEHQNNGKSGKPFKRQPDIITIADPDSGVGENCSVRVFVVTSQKSDKPNRVNYTPTTCQPGDIVRLNDGVEVIRDEIVLFRDNDSLEITCSESPPPG